MGREETSLTERLLRRERWILLSGLAAITVLSWIYILNGGGTGMSARSMTRAWLFPHRMAGMVFHPAGWAPAYWIIMLLMWWVMMIAMMTPSAAPCGSPKLCPPLKSTAYVLLSTGDPR